MSILNERYWAGRELSVMRRMNRVIWAYNVCDGNGVWCMVYRCNNGWWLTRHELFESSFAIITANDTTAAACVWWHGKIVQQPWYTWFHTYILHTHMHAYERWMMTRYGRWVCGIPRSVAGSFMDQTLPLNNSPTYSVLVSSLIHNYIIHNPISYDRTLMHTLCQRID